MIDFVREAVAIRPSLGGARFAQPAGITTVRVDPETGFLAGPDCPASVMVKIASRFAPVVDCYKHRPPELPFAEDAPTDAVYHDSTLDSEVITEDDQLGGAEEETTLTPPTEESEERPEHVPTPTRARQTLKERDQRNRTTLVNDPSIVDKP